MADNITLNAGSGGSLVKTDDDGTAHWQYVKVAYGADNTQTIVTAANGLTVQPDSSGFTVTANLSATDNAVLDSIVTNTTGLAGCVGGTELQVDIVSGGTVQYAEDAVHASGNTGTMALAVRNDTLAALAGTDGDYAPLQVNADGALYVNVENITNSIAAAATGGMSYAMLAMAAADNDAIIKATAGTVYYISVQSIDATPVYLKLFDAASITPGTTSADLQFMCPAAATAALGSSIELNFHPGIEFSTGICALIATGIAVDDNTAVSANEVIVTIGYE